MTIVDVHRRSPIALPPLGIQHATPPGRAAEGGVLLVKVRPIRATLPASVRKPVLRPSAKSHNLGRARDNPGLT
jgi:hypothetical protein